MLNGSETTPVAKTGPIEKNWKFTDIIKDPEIGDRFNKIRQYFFLRESTYDMTSHCNIKCDGCYFYEGSKQFAVDNRDAEAWHALMLSEKARGITYVVLAGAEPALAPELCEVCFEAMPLGAIATNGIKRIPASVGYKIHISVWGNDATSYKVRNARNMLERQIENYREDQRAVFVYTFTRSNIDEAQEVADLLAENDCKLTFNMFSAPVGYMGGLTHTVETLAKTRNVMLDLLSRYGQNILSTYNAVTHTHRLGLHDLFACPYPRMNPSTDIGLGRSFRQYRSDLTWDRQAACCVPDTDCVDCRHYASGSAVITARLFRHANNPVNFKAWLDYVDTYLAVWVMKYGKSPNLSNELVAPPGHNTF